MIAQKIDMPHPKGGLLRITLETVKVGNPMQRSIFIALGIAAAVIAWIASGVLAPSADTAGGNDGAGRPLTSVRVAEMQAQPLLREVRVNGRTEAWRIANVSAEISGRIAETPVERGAPVSEGDVLVRLAVEDRAKLVARARAQLEQKRIEFNAAESLSERGFNSEVRRAEAKAQLDAAEAELRRAELDYENTEITAPFDGVMDTRPVEIGDFVRAGDAIATVVELNPVKITGFVTERLVGRLALGETAQARIVGYGPVEGVISYIAASAQPGTRTFRVEIRVENADLRIPDGITAEIRIPLETEPAYLLSPSVLSLTDAGLVGVKTVDEDGVVHFHAAEVLQDGPEGMWLGGLPEAMTVITVGHDFVTAGEKVAPALAPAPNGREET